LEIYGIILVNNLKGCASITNTKTVTEAMALADQLKFVTGYTNVTEAGDYLHKHLPEFVNIEGHLNTDLHVINGYFVPLWIKQLQKTHPERIIYSTLFDGLNEYHQKDGTSVFTHLVFQLYYIIHQTADERITELFDWKNIEQEFSISPVYTRDNPDRMAELTTAVTGDKPTVLLEKRVYIGTIHDLLPFPSENKEMVYIHPNCVKDGFTDGENAVQFSNGEWFELLGYSSHYKSEVALFYNFKFDERLTELASLRGIDFCVESSTDGESTDQFYFSRLLTDAEKEFYLKEQAE
jgi:hypothetical protein